MVCAITASPDYNLSPLFVCAETRSPVAHLGWYHMQLRMGGSRASSSPGLGRQGRAALLDDAVLESDPGQFVVSIFKAHNNLGKRFPVQYVGMPG